ncbi:MAG: trehalase family glycosidase [Chitinophagaceae bacterium]
MLGAFSVAGGMLHPALGAISTDEKEVQPKSVYANDGKGWPLIIIKKDSMLSKSAGPNLTNLNCRVDVPVSGNISHLRIIGSGGEEQFVQALHAAESYVYYKSQFYLLADADEIHYEYALSYISVTYKNKMVPFEVTKKIYLHAKYTNCIQHVQVKNISSQPIEAYFIEKAKFTLGDPYFTNYAPYTKEGFNGFRVVNEVTRNYCSYFLMSGTDVVKVWSRDDQVCLQMETSKQPWTADQHVYKACDDQAGILQKKVVLSASEQTDFIIFCSVAPYANTASHGIPEVSAQYAKDGMAAFEKELNEQRDAFAMISTPDQLLDHGFSISNKIVAQVFQSADGLIAVPGHMYPSFYSRDSHWQIRGLLSAGKFEVVKELLVHFTRYQNEEGSFPTRITISGKPLYHTGAPDLDSAALISLSIIEYVRWTKDIAFGDKYWKSIAASIDYLRTRDTDNDGWVEQDYNQDWADRTKRHGKVNYTQCVYFQLLKESAALGDLLNKPEAATYKNLATRLKKNYDKLFWDEEAGLYLDYIAPDGTRMKKLSQDTCLAFIFGLATDPQKIKRHLSNLKEKCWTKWGPSHHEGYKEGNKYDPLGFYCNGGVWMWLTAFEAYAHFRYGDPENGVLALNAIKEYEFGKNPYSAVYFDTLEWHDSINGLNCEYDYKECRNFTTGSGAHVWAIVEGLFGVQQTIKGELTWNPRFPQRWKGKSVSINGIRKGEERIKKEFVV